MGIYLLKFSLCLLVFMLFYKFFLEKESIHHIKRIYLISVLFISIGIPMVTINQYVEVSAESVQMLTAGTEVEPLAATIINWKMLLIGIYSIGVLVCLVKFFINLFIINKRIRTNTKLRKGNIIQVLLAKSIAPHTFFNYIFFNKFKFEANLIPKEVIWHEQAHAKQKHSLDVLFIELVQVIFWFHPLIALLKKDIKLNHEFLADQAVLRHNSDPVSYQNTLLAFSTYESQSTLVNAINYSLIKKRFTVMKKQTSKTVVWVRSLLLLPLLAILLFSFASRSVIEIEPTDQEVIYETMVQKEASKEEVAEYNTLAKKYINMSKKGMKIEKQDMERLKFLYHKMSDSQRENAESFPVIPAPPAPEAIIAKKPDLPPPPPPLEDGASIEARKKYEEAVKLNKENPKKSEQQAYQAIKLNELKQKKDKAAAVVADEARMKRLKERAVLADAKNARAAELSKSKGTLKEERLKYAKERKAMFKSRKAERAEFKKRHTTDRKAELADARTARRVALKQVSNERRSKLRAERAVLAETRKLRSTESNTAHVKRMTEMNAIFYFEGKKISSAKAVELTEKTPDLHIQTRKGHNKTPEVYLSTKPIVIKEND